MSDAVRSPIIAGVACVLAGFAAGTVAPTTAALANARTQPAGPVHLLVYAQEWSLWPSSGAIRAGTVDVELWNRGEDAHDLRIRHLNAAGQMYGQVDGTMRVTPSGAISHAVWHLKPGRYELYCSLPGHLAMGMHAGLTVRPAT